MAIGSQFRVDSPVFPDEIFLRAIDQLHEHPNPARMPHELKAKALALMSSLDQPRHINDHEPPSLPLHHSKHWVHCGEGVVCYLGPRPAHCRQQRGFPRVRGSYQRDIRDQPHLER